MGGIFFYGRDSPRENRHLKTWSTLKKKRKATHVAFFKVMGKEKEGVATEGGRLPTKKTLCALFPEVCRVKKKRVKRKEDKADTLLKKGGQWPIHLKGSHAPKKEKKKRDGKRKKHRWKLMAPRMGKKKEIKSEGGLRKGKEGARGFFLAWHGTQGKHWPEGSGKLPAGPWVSPSSGRFRRQGVETQALKKRPGKKRLPPFYRKKKGPYPPGKKLCLKSPKNVGETEKGRPH